IWRYTREDKIPAITIGTRQYRYNLKDVLRSLDTNAPRDAAELQNPKYIDIVPKLIIEILSPSSRRTDTVSKLNLYLKHGRAR
ncbi:MAG: Uma2 family endonuclease, partial [Firmicutes bacterium]|nr:Uma2 family endonuclease [Bacillota bacterium]